MLEDDLSPFWKSDQLSRINGLINFMGTIDWFETDIYLLCRFIRDNYVPNI
jgi:hypothetical protein